MQSQECSSPHPQNRVSTNWIQSISLHHVLPSSVLPNIILPHTITTQKYFSPMETSNKNSVCIYCFQYHAHPYNIWRTGTDTEPLSVKTSLSCGFQILNPGLQRMPSCDVTPCSVMWSYRRLPTSTRSKLPMSPFRRSTRRRTPQLGGYFVRSTF